jgi:hypothetical protein
VTDDKPFRATTLKALGLSKLSEIPERIPTVTWSWIAAGRDMAENIMNAKVKGKSRIGDSSQEENREFVLPHEFLHAAFHERSHVGQSWNGGNSNSERKRKVQGSQSQDASQELRIAGPSCGFSLYSGLLTLKLGSDRALKDREDWENDEGSTSDRASQTRDLFEERNNALPSADPLAEFYALAKAQRDAAVTFFSHNGFLNPYH